MKCGGFEAGRYRVLIVEDEALIAHEIMGILIASGYDVVGPAGRVDLAFALVDEHGCDVAVLDIALGQETSEPVALELRKRGTPFVTLSSYLPEQRPPAFDDVPALTKPVSPDVLVAAIRCCLANAGRN
jgi:DNA-binding response OmpR family regulator